MPMSPGFAPFLAGVDLGALEQSPDVIHGLDATRCLGYFNSSWERFAAANAAPDFATRWGLGSSLEDAIDVPELRDFYRHALAVTTAEHPFRHTYECSSPDRYRSFHMTILPLPGRGGFLVVSSLIEDLPMEEKGRAARRFEAARYRRKDGIVLQCASCRRTSTTDREVWDWVPELLEPGTNLVSHGLCPVCLALYCVS